MAEGSLGVGKATSVVVLSHSPTGDKIEAHELSEGFVGEIRAGWETDGKPRVPGWIDSRIAEGRNDEKKFLRVTF